MKKEEIRDRIAKWGMAMTTRYPGLRIRFEHSERRQVFLVSLSPDKVDDQERFSIDVMAFEDEMEYLYGHYAPLFCDNEELFQLSAEAEMVEGFVEEPISRKWHFSVESIFAENDIYNLAA